MRFFKAADFAKAAIDTELARLDRLLSDQEEVVREAFADFVRTAKDDRLVRMAADFLERGDIEAALRLLDSHITRLATVFPTVFQNIASAELTHIAAQLAPLVPTVGVSFDPTDAPAAMRMREQTLEFIREFTDGQRLSTRQALANSLEVGDGTQGQARAFRDSIGLTARQEAAVRNYRRLLKEGRAEALTRALRDRRYDRSVQRAVDGEKPLTDEQVETMVARYRARYLSYRSEMIARTETMPTMQQAREEAYRQNLAQAGIPEAAVDQTWNTTLDGRERPTHHSLNGQTVPLGQAFQSPSGAALRYPGDPRAPAAETIQCRCQRTFKINTSRV